MYRRIFSVLCLLVTVSFLASSVSAMPPGPGFPAPAPKPPARPFQPFVPDLKTVADLEEGGVSAQSIALGKSGSAYRYTAVLGKPGQAYPDNVDYLNGPFGLAFDDAGLLYFGEQDGARLFSYSTDFDVDEEIIWRYGAAGFHDFSETGLAYPNEVAVGPDDTLWVTDRGMIRKLQASTGKFIASYQDEIAAFSQLRGIAFDSTGRLFVVDYDTHVVHIFTLDVDGNPEYSATIGVQDSPGSDDLHFNNPTQIVIDSADKLYVADSGNNRVQVCTESGEQWSCELYTDSNTDLEHLENEIALDDPYGLGIDSLDQIYIADTKNSRVLRCVEDSMVGAKCTPIATPGDGDGELVCPVDAALKPGADYLFVSDWCDNAVKVYKSDGSLYKVFKGNLAGQPYEWDASYLNGPRGIKLDKAGNIYVLEELGKRVVKLDKTGAMVLWASQIWTPKHNDPINPRLPHNISLDKLGNVLVSGPGRQVWLLNGKTGLFIKDMATEWSEPPDFAGGTAVDAAGNTYVSDIWGQRVLVFNKTNQFVRQIGVTGEMGSENDHFAWPQGLALDKQSNLYVADAGNCRVQKFDKLGRYKLTFSTQKCGGELDSMNGPVDVAVDSKGNVLVADTWNNRVQVYNPAGAYLTTIGGNWGDRTGQLRSPAGVAVDGKGAVYVADEQNHRIMKYTPGVPYAAQININGFGKKANPTIGALLPFKGQLYAGTFRYEYYGAQIYRQTKTGWEAVMNDAFEEEGNVGINTLAEYQGFMYAGTQNCFEYDQGECMDSNGAQIYRSQDGLTWQPVMQDGFDDLTNVDVFKIASLSSQICATTYSAYHGGEIYCSTSGDPYVPGSSRPVWERVVEDGLENPMNEAFTALVEFNGGLYAGSMNREEGAEIYRKVGDGEWELVNSGGFDDPSYTTVSAMAVFKGYLYTLLYSGEDTPVRLYRCQNCDDSDWELVTGNAFDNPASDGLSALEATSKYLYAVIGNSQTGLEVWNTLDGKTWKPVILGGFGSSNNEAPYWDHSVTVLKNILYIGTTNYAAGGEVWKVCAGASCK